MKNMTLRRTVVLFICFALLMSLSGCVETTTDKNIIIESSTTDDDTNGENNGTINNTQGSKDEDENSDDNGTTNNTQESENEKSATISEQKCFDYNGLTVTAKEIVEDSFWGTGIKLLVENNTDKDYSVGTKEVIVNNCMTASLFSSTVAAGKKANETLYLSTDDLEAAGIDNIGQIEIYFYVYDSSTYQTVYEAECVTVRTSLYDEMDTEANKDGVELYNKNGIKIVGKYVSEDTFWGSAVLLYIENTGAKNITVSCDDMSVNGFMITGLMSETVYAGKCTVGDITILSTELEENNISTIEQVELKFNIYESDTYKTIDKTDVISFKAQ